MKRLLPLFALSAAFLFAEQGVSQKKRQYDLLENSGSGVYILKKEAVSKKQLKGEYYRVKNFSGSKLISIAQYDYKAKKPKLFDSHYDAAMIKFKYTKEGKPQKISFYDSKKKLSGQNPYGAATLEYVYDSTGRIAKELRKNKKGKLVTHTEAKYAAVTEYTYMGNSIKKRVLDHTNNILEDLFISQTPCIPYIDCPPRF